MDGCAEPEPKQAKEIHFHYCNDCKKDWSRPADKCYEGCDGKTVERMCPWCVNDLTLSGD